MNGQVGTVVRESPGTWGRISGVQVAEWAGSYGVLAGITDRTTDFRLAARGVPVSFDGLLVGVGNAFRSIVVSRQVHGAEVHVHEVPEPGVHRLEGVDGHVTGHPGVLLAVTVADCVPVYLAHPESGGLALLHAGWRGIAAGLLEAGLRAMVQVAGCTSRDLVMHCGPAICGDCYEVGPEVVEALGGGRPSGRATVDLRATLVERAAQAGVARATISGWCTAHDRERFHSHRASAGGDGRQVAILGHPMA